MDYNEKIELLKKCEMQYVEKNGFVVHAMCEDNDKNDITYHTHYVKDILGLPYDILITLPISQKTAYLVINSIINKMKDGFIFEDGKAYPNIATGIGIIKTVVNPYDKDYLVIVFPDINYKFPGNELCSELYNGQLDPEKLKAHIVS